VTRMASSGRLMATTDGGTISRRITGQGSGVRVTLNSYMYGDALAIAHIADLHRSIAPPNASGLRRQNLNCFSGKNFGTPESSFLRLPRNAEARLSDVRELHGYTPWFFNRLTRDKSPAGSSL